MQFVLGVDGRVAKIGLRQSTLGESGRADQVACLAARPSEAWQFPASQGGGIVVVGYPFHFGAR